MQFSELAKALAAIESTTQRTMMVRLLVNLFKKLGPDEIDKAIYIILGDVRPPWEGVELGVGEKLCLRAIARASGSKAEELESLYQKLGDMGEVAKRALSRRQASTLLAFAQGAKGRRRLAGVRHPPKGGQDLGRGGARPQGVLVVLPLRPSIAGGGQVYS
jgi:DNA ligase-1